MSGAMGPRSVGPRSVGPRSVGHCLVTGASAGLGAGLAYRLSIPGIELTLVARRAEALESVAEICRARGAVVRVLPGDVADHARIEALVRARDAERPIDTIIANAGIGGSAGRRESASDAARIFATNLTGAVATVAPIAWGEAQRRAWRGSGVDISIVCPGFVRTDMIEGLRFRAPFVWSVDKAADRIVRGLDKGEARIAFPWQMRAAIGAARLLPRPLAEAAFGGGG